MAPAKKYQTEIVTVNGKEVTKYICPFCNSKLGSVQACYRHVKDHHKTETAVKPCEATNENQVTQVISIPDTTPLRKAKTTPIESVSRKEFDELKAQNQIIIQQNQTIIEMLKNLTNGNMYVQVAKDNKTKEQIKADNLDKEVAKLREQEPIQVPSDANDKTKTIKERYEKARQNYLNHPYCVMVDVDGDKLPCWRCPTCKEDYKTSPRYLINHLNNTNRKKIGCRKPNEAVLLTEVVDRYDYYAKEYKKLDGKEEVKAETNEVEQQTCEASQDVVEDVSQEEQELVKAIVHDIIKNVVDKSCDKAEEPEDDLTEEQVMQVKQVIDEVLQLIDNGADLVAEVKEFISMRMDNDKTEVEVIDTPVQDKIENVVDNVAKPCEEHVYDISQDEPIQEVSKASDNEEFKTQSKEFLIECCRTLYDGGFAKAYHHLNDHDNWHIMKDVDVKTWKSNVTRPITKKDKDGNDLKDEFGGYVYDLTKKGELKYKTVKETFTREDITYKVWGKHNAKAEKNEYKKVGLSAIRNHMEDIYNTLFQIWTDYRLSKGDAFDEDGVFDDDPKKDTWLSISHNLVNTDNLQDFFYDYDL